MAMPRTAATVPVPERLLTVDEFIKMPESNERYELIRGRLVKKPLPDVGWWQFDRVPELDAEIAPVPDLAIEIQSPGQTVGDLTAKALDYLAGGSRLAWVFYPDAERVEIFRPGQTEPERLGIDATLSGEDVIPGFSVTMRGLHAKSMPKP